jgi:hypothetical protein
MIILYTTHCPKCEILEKKLKAKEITYNICEDTPLMEEKGFIYLPILEVDGKALSFSDAISFINNK